MYVSGSRLYGSAGFWIAVCHGRSCPKLARSPSRSPTSSCPRPSCQLALELPMKASLGPRADAVGNERGR